MSVWPCASFGCRSLNWKGSGASAQSNGDRQLKGKGQVKGRVRTEENLCDDALGGAAAQPERPQLVELRLLAHTTDVGAA